jgi:hypothetical protein
MDRLKQYEHLVELVARARMLAAYSDDEIVNHNANKIKTYGSMSATSLGYSEAVFKSDSIKRYHELNGSDK